MYQDYWFNVIDFLNIKERYSHQSTCREAKHCSDTLGWSLLSKRIFNTYIGIEQFKIGNWRFCSTLPCYWGVHNNIYFQNICIQCWTPWLNLEQPCQRMFRLDQENMSSPLEWLAFYKWTSRIRPLADRASRSMNCIYIQLGDQNLPLYTEIRLKVKVNRLNYLKVIGFELSE